MRSAPMCHVAPKIDPPSLDHLFGSGAEQSKTGAISRPAFQRRCELIGKSSRLQALEAPAKDKYRSTSDGICNLWQPAITRLQRLGIKKNWIAVSSDPSCQGPHQSLIVPTI